MKSERNYKKLIKMAQDLATLSDLSSGTLLSILKTYLANEAKNQGAKLDFTKYEVQGSKIEIIMLVLSFLALTKLLLPAAFQI